MKKTIRESEFKSIARQIGGLFHEIIAVTGLTEENLNAAANFCEEQEKRDIEIISKSPESENIKEMWQRMIWHSVPTKIAGNSYHWVTNSGKRMTVTLIDHDNITIEVDDDSNIRNYIIAVKGE